MHLCVSYDREIAGSNLSESDSLASASKSWLLVLASLLTSWALCFLVCKVVAMTVLSQHCDKSAPGYLTTCISHHLLAGPSSWTHSPPDVSRPGSHPMFNVHCAQESPPQRGLLILSVRHWSPPAPVTPSPTLLFCPARVSTCKDTL